MICNVLGMPEDHVKVSIKNYDDGLMQGPGKLFTLINGVYL